MKKSHRVWVAGLALGLSAQACVGSSPPGRLDENGDECPLTDARGEVTLVASQGASWVGMEALARFQRSTPAREAVSCQRRTVGTCEISACQRLGVDFVNGEPACGSTSGGALLLTRGDVALPRVEGSALLTFDRALEPGETFGVRTTGGDVPAFAAAIQLPSRTTVTGPEALTRGGSLEVAADGGVTVTWTPTASRVLIIATGNVSTDFRAECAFDGAAGVGTVAAAALPQQTGHVEVWTEQRVDQRVGAFPVMVRARWSMGVGASLIRGSGWGHRS